MAKNKASSKRGTAVGSTPLSQTLTDLGNALATALKKDGVGAVIEQLESGLGLHVKEKPTAARGKSSKKATKKKKKK